MTAKSRCVVFATVVAAAGAPTVPVVFAAQVVNGILLPFLTARLPHPPASHSSGHRAA